jgi:hypothetical protein
LYQREGFGGGSFGLHEGQKRFDQVSIELSVRDFVAQMTTSLGGGAGWSIGPPGRDGVIHVNDPHHLRQQRDIAAPKAVRVPAPIEPLVMVADDRLDMAERLQRLAEALADDRVPPHQITLGTRQLPGFEEHRIGDAYLPDIVQVSAAAQCLEVLAAQAEYGAQPHGLTGQAFAVPVGQRIARLEGKGQRDKCSFSRVELVD